MTAVQISTFSDLLTDLAEKIGETTSSTIDARKRKINSAYHFIANKRLWWWLEGTNPTTITTTTSLNYDLPTDFRAFHPLNPLQVGTSWYNQIPFREKQLHDGTTGVVQLPSLKSKNTFYVYAGKYYFVQASMTAGQTVTLYYYKLLTALDGNTDTPFIPIEFREMISLWAAGMHLKSQGGKESAEGNDYLELFDTFLTDMEREDDNRREFGIKRRALDPEEALVLQRK